MYLWSHFLFALLVGEFFVHLGVLNHWHALAAGLITLAIDIDHVVTAYWHYGELDIKRAWNNAAIHHRFSERTTLHHRGGVIIITAFCALLYFYNFIWFMIAAIGYYSHMLLDQVHNKNIILKDFDIVFKTIDSFYSPSKSYFSKSRLTKNRT